MRDFSTSHIASNAQLLRKEMTNVEQLLWSRLRGKQLGVKFRRQHPFLRFVLDFVCLELQIVIEIDGSQHVAAMNYDNERTKRLNDAGYLVLRFWNNQVIDELENVLEEIFRQVELRKKEFGRTPSPSPSQPSP